MKTKSDKQMHDEHKDIQVNVAGPQQLPEPFADLAPYLAWALPTHRERSVKRQTSTRADINAFYHAMLPRMEEILTYLAQYPVRQAPAAAQRLFYQFSAERRIELTPEFRGRIDAQEQVGRLVFTGEEKSDAPTPTLTVELSALE